MNVTTRQRVHMQTNTQKKEETSILSKHSIQFKRENKQFFEFIFRNDLKRETFHAK